MQIELGLLFVAKLGLILDLELGAGADKCAFSVHLLNVISVSFSKITSHPFASGPAYCPVFRQYG